MRSGGGGGRGRRRDNTTATRIQMTEKWQRWAQRADLSPQNFTKGNYAMWRVSGQGCWPLPTRSCCSSQPSLGALFKAGKERGQGMRGYWKKPWKSLIRDSSLSGIYYTVVLQKSISYLHCIFLTEPLYNHPLRLSSKQCARKRDGINPSLNRRKQRSLVKCRTGTQIQDPQHGVTILPSSLGPESTHGILFFGGPCAETYIFSLNQDTFRIPCK